VFPDYRTHPIRRTQVPATLALWNIDGSLEDREFNSSDQIKEVITKVWDKLTFNEVQSVFHNWMSRLTWNIENDGE
jgi:hypothetical protein